MRRGKSRRQGQTLYLKRIAFSLWLLYYLLLRSNPSFRTHRVQRDLNFVVVGFYEGAVQCEALLSAVAVGATFIPLNLSTHDGTSVTERQRRALRGLGRTAPNPYLQVHSLRWDAVVLELNWKSFLFLLAQRHSRDFRGDLQSVTSRHDFRACKLELDECFPRIVKARSTVASTCACATFKVHFSAVYLIKMSVQTRLQ